MDKDHHDEVFKQDLLARTSDITHFVASNSTLHVICHLPRSYLSVSHEGSLGSGSLDQNITGKGPQMTQKPS